MELLTHDMPALFAHLGLANDEISLHRFIREHPLDVTVHREDVDNNSSGSG